MALEPNGTFIIRLQVQHIVLIAIQGCAALNRDSLIHCLWERVSVTYTPYIYLLSLF